MENIDNMIKTWCGRDLGDYTKEELIEIINTVCKERDQNLDYLADLTVKYVKEKKKAKKENT